MTIPPQVDNSTSFDCYMIGSESLLIQCAQILLERGHTIHGIITTTPAIKVWAKENNILHLPPNKQLVDTLHRQPFDYFFNITNLSIIPPKILTLPRRAAINFHDGPLPRYAGLYATSWALLNHESSYGITWHLMTDGVDEGDILKQQTFRLTSDETAFTLNAKCYEAGMISFAELVDELATGQIEAQSQDLHERTYFAKSKRPPAAATLNWHDSAANLDALRRALDFGPYANPLALPKLLMKVAQKEIGSEPILPEELTIVKHLEQADGTTTAPPGTIIAIDDVGLTVATADGQIVIRQLSHLSGQDLPLSDLIQKLRPGMQLLNLDAADSAHLSQLNQTLARYESFWQTQLATLTTVELPYAKRTEAAKAKYAEETLSTQHSPEILTAAFVAYLGRISNTNSVSVGYHHEALAQTLAGFESYFAPYVPLTIQINQQNAVNTTIEQLLAHVQKLKERQSYSQDLPLRQPDLTPPNYPIVVADETNTLLPPETELAMLIGPDGTIRWVYDTTIFDKADIRTMLGQFSLLLQHLTYKTPLAQVSLLSEAERNQILYALNDTAFNYQQDVCIHHQFEAQVAKTPDDIALVFETSALTYRQLNTQANQLAHHLQALGVGPDIPVGIYMERSFAMVVALLGILKAGGAYLPLDPEYPADRLEFMVKDAAIPVILTTANLIPQLPPHQAKIVPQDTDWPLIANQPTHNPAAKMQPKNLSYIIYTSGSTGKPKGVMVQHNNVINFFAAMDQVVPYDPPGTWLAVTSLSFDISVLELFWPLTHGFKIILYRGASALSIPHSNTPIDFSLFYFASDESEEGVADKYHLLLEGARFADENGFVAIWTPERHFHAFGGLYPNPSVAGAALAAITKHTGIRAGSCVLPLHSPIRVAEEWALVDNLSKGRVGISFASGWQPNDFVLMPENYDDRKAIMFRDIEVVRQLWRGQSVQLPGPKGDMVEVRTLPRPIQPELPVWVTTAGNPETYRQAGENGFHILTHLLGQTVDDLAAKLALYRQAWTEAGHPGQGTVSLMLHTFVGNDDDAVREIVRVPMTEYLRSAIALVKAAAWHFPTFRQKAEAAGKNAFEMFDSEDLTPEDMEALLAFAFDRYFTHSGLFGTPETCLNMVRQLKEIGVNEIACLIDFGVPSAMVLEQLPALNRVKELATAKPAASNLSIPDLIETHGVTHFQCTPSMASMLLGDSSTKAALGNLQTFLLGGEALAASLATALKEVVSGNIVNMYGPTETTVWSTTFPVDSAATATVSIGTPIANTQVYILDANLQPVPTGVPGELYIGGDGVVRGYLNRANLTAERFIANPFTDSGARLYKTGDLVRYRPDSQLEFLGRLDHQVKLRGYRIELGEIESLLNQHPTVRETVIIMREDTPGDVRLVAYVIARQGQQPDTATLRDYLRNDLPEFMIPAHVVLLDKFPLTPNKKINRNALPAPERSSRGTPKIKYIPPQNELEGTIITIWQELLHIEQIGVNDNFFDLGGHSLLTVQAHRRLCLAENRDISITDMFRFPTVRSLAEFLGRQQDQPGAEQPTMVQKSIDRAKTRREAMLRRRR